MSETQDFVVEGGSSGVPADNYKATFTRWEVSDEATEYSKKSLRLIFTVTAPEEFAGAETSVMITLIKPDGYECVPTSKNKYGRLLAGLANITSVKGVQFSLKSYVGESYLIKVVETKSGTGTTVDSVMVDRF